MKNRDINIGHISFTNGSWTLKLLPWVTCCTV